MTNQPGSWFWMAQNCLGGSSHGKKIDVSWGKKNSRCMKRWSTHQAGRDETRSGGAKLIFPPFFSRSSAQGSSVQAANFESNAMSSLECLGFFTGSLIFFDILLWGWRCMLILVLPPLKWDALDFLIACWIRDTIHPSIRDTGLKKD